MKKPLHYLFLFLTIVFVSVQLQAQQKMVSVKIVKTGTEAGVDVSYDDGEFENEAIDKLYDDDLDMGWEGEDLNVMTTFLRFQNVMIPQGATIDSAILFIYAHEDEEGEAKVTISGDAADNSSAFVETELITARTWTTASKFWNINDNWTIWQPYRSPDFKNVIQEIVDRDGWVSGNNLTIFLRGEDQGASLLDNARDFESFENIEDPEDGGDGLHHPERIPELKIYFTSSSQTIAVRIVKTGEEAGVDVSYDDGEFENDAIDKLYDDDLDMGWEGEDLNVMTTFLRFQNIQIPQGATIESAVLDIFAHEDEEGEAKITIFAEDSDNSSAFVETELITARNWTNASVPWTITEPWTIWQPYSSPDFSSVIQQVVNRSGWTPGNALTIFLRGEDQGASLLDNARDFESFENIEDPEDGGDGLHHPERIPLLHITFSGNTSVFEGSSVNAPLSIFPTYSTNGIFNVKMDHEDLTMLKVFNQEGRIVFENSFEDTAFSFRLMNQQSGLYLVQAVQNGKLYVSKLIIH